MGLIEFVNKFGDFLWRGESTTLNVLTQDDWFSSATKLIIKVEDIKVRKCEIVP